MSSTLNLDARLSLQKALLGEITNNMRAVMVACSQNEIKFRVVFSGNPSFDDKMRVSEIETEVIADFLDDVTVTGSAESSDPAERIQYKENEIPVFHRAEHEDDLDPI